MFMTSQAQNQNSIPITIEGKAKPHPVDEYVGREIKKQRIMKGMSQNQLASRLGITFQQVQKYEKGTNRIVISRLYELARVLGIEINDLMSKLQNDIRSITEGTDISITCLQEGDEASLEEFDHNYNDGKEVLMLVRAYRRIKSEKMRGAIHTLVKVMCAEQSNDDYETSYRGPEYVIVTNQED
ncbi:helix-turn-helix domain-containing protein [Anaplasma phagocytophilum]|nr:helix-turn-helix transcriptional regulator [Anaplasma phagocytophilum]AAN15209.1 putative transcriptional regulator [Anaplasma phagocytophilum]ABD43546.1 DNA-binding protein [Anaplasma phagocytophilum str. HZ]AGR79085.1 transcriptional regulator [Anaplasma phagocytophilum str. HZ2]AGR80333.1 transcriptional regulator [Anaplasma phagocytophilum str. JM]AGR81587.1 transcriptional regulator [Anaplasma phagocytophilum str. Dog2]